MNRALTDIPRIFTPKALGWETLGTCRNLHMGYKYSSIEYKSFFGFFFSSPQKLWDGRRWAHVAIYIWVININLLNTSHFWGSFFFTPKALGWEQPRSQGLSFCHLGETLAAAGHVPPRFWEVNLIVTVRGVGKERVCSVLKLQLWVMKFTVNLQQEIVKRTRDVLLYNLVSSYNSSKLDQISL